MNCYGLRLAALLEELSPTLVGGRNRKTPVVRAFMIGRLEIDHVNELLT